MGKKNPIETSPLIEKYLTYKSAVQERTEKTVENYRVDLRVFFRYLVAKRHGIDPESDEGAEISIEEVDADFVRSVTAGDILEFIVFEKSKRGNGASARARKLSALRSFFKYTTVHEHITEKNVAADIESPKQKKSLPKFLTESESLDLLRAVANDKTSKSRARDYCMITLFLNCGMRLSELVGINLSDIATDLSSLRVLGKGRKERIIYLNGACRHALSEYILARNKIEKEIKDKNALFISNRGTRISNQMVQKTVEKYLMAAGLGNRSLSTHKLRHTAATLLYQKGGVDVLTLKEILGHEQLSTTQIYTHISNDAVMQAASKHPLSGVMRDDFSDTPDDDDE
ncbi:MAG: tyrosine recombinase XerC [Clostridiales bacterium]|nr:tyrosine recombinase XerC [Clostridiales bacterium]